ncbi:protein phosphatase 1D [Coccinella septempunctata]|uniref:protein phosphatase 1D n=1 Tax=Coccinella septempunctata TaxID=41139 RepID=UPI001D079058|nr:protein phosphatase 1D [Coccinella septempunctata]
MSIGVNLRVTGYCRQGGRKYMEDFFSVAYQQTEDEKDLEYAFIGIFDGHGGAEAAAFAKEHLMESIIKHKSFWSDNDTEVLRAIKDGYIATHYAMWKEQAKWPKTPSGLPSTAGTTASVAFIRRGKIYVGHVGDSGIVLGYQLPNTTEWRAKPLTKDHKPENAEEMTRIKECGGKVVAKAGVPRVVWNRPRIGHQGPIRRSTPIDEIPFLAVARSLGDLWSYNSRLNQFIVSPNPDCGVIAIDTSIHRCLIFGTDGLFNMMSPQLAVSIVHQTEKNNEVATVDPDQQKTWLNPSKLLVEKALERWRTTNMRADNTSVVTLMLDPPGPPRAQVLQRKHKQYPMTGFKIVTRFKDDEQSSEDGNVSESGSALEENEHPITKEDVTPTVSEEIIEETSKVENPQSGEEPKSEASPNCSTKSQVPFSEVSSNPLPLKERNFVPKARDSMSFDPREPYSPSKLQNEKENQLDKSKDTLEVSVQINEISSSSTDLFESVEEEPENDQGSLIRHNLRSMGKFKELPATEQKPKLKRKSNEEEPLRKSMRIDNARRKSDRLEGNRKINEKNSKLKLARKLLKKKNIDLKKKILKRPSLRKKFRMMMESVKQSSKSSLMRISAKGALPKRNNAVVPSDVSKCIRGSSTQKTQKSAPKRTKRSLSEHLEDTESSRRESDGLRLSSSGEWKVDTVKKCHVAKKTALPRMNETVKRRTKSLGGLDKYHREEISKTPLVSGRKTPQRVSLRHNPQNQTSKLRRRLSKSK